MADMNFKANSLIRSAIVSSIVLTPFVMFVTRALQNQNSDNLIPIFVSTDHFTTFFWGQNRFGNVLPLLALPIQSIKLNLVFQVYLRAFSIVFVLLWLSLVMAHITKANKFLMSVLSLLVGFGWIWNYTDGLDSLVYGAVPHVNSVLFAVFAVYLLSCTGYASSDKSVLWKLIFSIGSLIFWGVAAWASLLIVIWSPALVMLFLALENDESRKNRVSLLGRFFVHLTPAAIAAFFFAKIAISGGQQSSWGSYGVREAIRTNPYIYNNLIIAIVLIVLSLILVRGMRHILLITSSASFLIGIPVIAGFAHVKAYYSMPRYFGVPLLFAVLIPALFICGSCLAMLGSRVHLHFPRIPKHALALFAGLAVVVLAILGSQQVKHGSGKPDAVGFVNSATSLKVEQFLVIENSQSRNLQFISGNFWRVWPTVFELRSHGQEVLGITKLAINQSQFSRLYSGQTLYGLCIDEVEKCHGSAINAQLDDRRLRTEVRETPIAQMSDGTSIRLMTVTYP